MFRINLLKKLIVKTVKERAGTRIQVKMVKTTLKELQKETLNCREDPVWDKVIKRKVQ